MVIRRPGISPYQAPTPITQPPVLPPSSEFLPRAADQRFCSGDAGSRSSPSPTRLPDRIRAAASQYGEHAKPRLEGPSRTLGGERQVDRPPISGLARTHARTRARARMDKRKQARNLKNARTRSNAQPTTHTHTLTRPRPCPHPLGHTTRKSTQTSFQLIDSSTKAGFLHWGKARPLGALTPARTHATLLLFRACCCCLLGGSARARRRAETWSSLAWTTPQLHPTPDRWAVVAVCCRHLPRWHGLLPHPTGRHPADGSSFLTEQLGPQRNGLRLHPSGRLSATVLDTSYRDMYQVHPLVNSPCLLRSGDCSK
jgi:hypothetical protein